MNSKGTILINSNGTIFIKELIEVTHSKASYIVRIYNAQYSFVMAPEAATRGVL